MSISQIFKLIQKSLFLTKQLRFLLLTVLQLNLTLFKFVMQLTVLLLILLHPHTQIAYFFILPPYHLFCLLTVSLILTLFPFAITPQHLFVPLFIFEFLPQLSDLFFKHQANGFFKNIQNDFLSSERNQLRSEWTFLQSSKKIVLKQKRIK